MNRISIKRAGRQSQTGTSLTRAGMVVGGPVFTGQPFGALGSGVAARMVDCDRFRAADGSGEAGLVEMMIEHAASGYVGSGHFGTKHVVTQHMGGRMAVIKPSNRPAAGRDPKG